MTSYHTPLRFRTSLAIAALVASACVEAPTGADTEATAGTSDPLVLTFDQLASQATATGDVARAEGFTFASIAARSGITPTLVSVRVNGNTTELYEAFVNSIEFNLATPSLARIPAHRTIVAWRRTSDGVTRIFSLTTPSDSAPVLHPMSLSATSPVSAPFAGASGLYQETRTLGTLGNNNTASVDEFWIATLGYVKIREVSLGADCPVDLRNAGLSGIRCRQARFQIRFQVDMQRLATRPYTLAPTSVSRRFAMPVDTAMAGYKLTLSCPSVSASRGCG